MPEFDPSTFIPPEAPNPLKKHFRQPKVYITLPSKGNFYPEGSLNMPESGEIPVYSMTAADELTMKTPDALLNGQATVDVIQSCIPAIKDAWKLPSVDLDVCLIAIRLATYGEQMTLKIKTPVTGEEKEMGVDLRQLLDQFANIEYNDVVMLPEMTIRLRPLNYREFTDGALKTFEEQRIFNVVNDDSMKEEDKLQAFTNSFAKSVTSGTKRPRLSTKVKEPMPLSLATLKSSAPKLGAICTIPVPSSVVTKSPIITLKASPSLGCT